MRHPRDKHRRRLVSLLTACVALLLSLDASAGPWEQPRGDCYAKLWLRGIYGDQAFLADGGEPVDSATYADTSLNHYVECGLPQRLTLVASGQPVGFAKYADNSAAYIGNLGLGLRRSFLHGPVRLGVQADYAYQGLLGDDNLARGTSPPGLIYRPTVNAHTGRLTASAGYGASWGWLSLDTGIQAWSRVIPPAIVALAQVGLHATERLTLDVHFPIRQQLQTIADTNLSGAGPTSYIGFGLGLSWAFTSHLALAATFEGAAARANAATPSLMLGIEWFKRK